LALRRYSKQAKRA